MKELIRLINKTFPLKESEVLIKLINGHTIIVSPNSTEYQTFRRVRNKLRTIKEILTYDDIEEILKDKRIKN